jgi:hypothetical protein
MLCPDDGMSIDIWKPKEFLTRKNSEGQQAKRRRKGKNLSPRERKACHSASMSIHIWCHSIYKYLLMIIPSIL